MDLMPSTGKGVLIALGVVLALLLWRYVVTAIAFVMGLVIIAVVLYLVYVLAIRGHRLAIEGRR